MNSVEAAALYLSDGATKDPLLASMMADKSAPMIGEEALKLDRQQRAALREMMGFDFQIKVAFNKIHVYAKDEIKASTWCRYKGEMDEEQVDKLVDACVRLKKKHDKKMELLANA